MYDTYLLTYLHYPLTPLQKYPAGAHVGGYNNSDSYIVLGDGGAMLLVLGECVIDIRACSA